MPCCRRSAGWFNPFHWLSSHRGSHPSAGGQGVQRRKVARRGPLGGGGKSGRNVPIGHPAHETEAREANAVTHCGCAASPHCGRGVSVPRSDPVYLEISQFGNAFWSSATPPSVTWVSERASLCNAVNPERCARPASVTARKIRQRQPLDWCHDRPSGNRENV